MTHLMAETVSSRPLVGAFRITGNFGFPPRYWLYNDTLKLDRPIACGKSKQDCSPASFRLVEVIDTAKTDGSGGHPVARCPFNGYSEGLIRMRFPVPPCRRK
jgi:hypothetical protein